MKQRAACLVGAVVLLSACSDGTGPAPAAGVFGASLTGALVATVSGPSNAGVIYREDLPEGQFTIRMSALPVSTTRLIAVACPGQEPPARGRHVVSEQASDCQGSYYHLTSTQAGTSLLEHVTASSGSVTITTKDGGRIRGAFSFSGILVAGSDSMGTLGVSGTFDAVMLP